MSKKHSFKSFLKNLPIFGRRKDESENKILSDRISRILLKNSLILGTRYRQLSSHRYAAYCLNNFAVILTGKVYNINKDVYDVIDKFFGGSENREGFYKHPLETTELSSEKLELEQIASYFMFENGLSDGKRIELFITNFSQYYKGTESKPRIFKVIDEAEAKTFLESLLNNYLSYTRKWGMEEKEDVLAILDYLPDFKIYEVSCKDNIISLIVETDNYQLAEFLDYKDIVKWSLSTIGERNKHFRSVARENKEFMKINNALNYAKPCRLTKKQAKYFNKICHFFNKDLRVIHNSPYVEAKRVLKSGNAVKAAKILANNGSLLERNIVWLLSRAKNKSEKEEILNMLSDKNPIVLYQLLSQIKPEQGDARTFVFFNNNAAKSHVETEYETKWRKSVLDEETHYLLVSYCREKISAHYSKAKIGKVYVSDIFKKVALPTNTSASSSGLDVYPSGTRLPITHNFIRTFVYWNNIPDIDSAALFFKEDSSYPKELSWRTYSSEECKETFGTAALSSADDRSMNGVEYQDFNISELRSKGFKKCVFIFYSYDERNFNKEGASVNCGFQFLNEQETNPWNPKNNEVNISVRGKGAVFVGFLIDLEAMELVVINSALNSYNTVFTLNDLNVARKYENATKYLSMHDIITSLATDIVDDPKEADYIFDEKYPIDKVLPNQKLVRPTDISTLVSLINR